MVQQAAKRATCACPLTVHSMNNNLFPQQPTDEDIQLRAAIASIVRRGASSPALQIDDITRIVALHTMQTELRLAQQHDDMLAHAMQVLDEYRAIVQLYQAKAQSLLRLATELTTQLQAARKGEA